MRGGVSPLFAGSRPQLGRGPPFLMAQFRPASFAVAGAMRPLWAEFMGALRWQGTSRQPEGVVTFDPSAPRREDGARRRGGEASRQCGLVLTAVPAVLVRPTTDLTARVGAALVKRVAVVAALESAGGAVAVVAVPDAASAAGAAGAGVCAGVDGCLLAGAFFACCAFAGYAVQCVWSWWRPMICRPFVPGCGTSRPRSMVANSSTAPEQAELTIWTIVHPICRVGAVLPASPDTTAARAAVDLMNAVSGAPLIHHVWRTWYFGSQLIGQHVADADLEVAFVAAILHDLGLTGRFDAEAPFEQAGAAAAAATLAGLGWSEDRIHVVSAAIAGHLDLASAEARPEIALVHLGAAADVIGLHVDQLPGELIEEVLNVHPRNGFVDAVLPALQHQAVRKPQSTIAGLFRTVSFEKLMRGCPLDSR